MREIEGTLVSVREAERTLLPRVCPVPRAQVATALSPGALAPFDQLLVQLGQIIAPPVPVRFAAHDRPDNRRKEADLARTELFRLITTDLDRAVKALEQAACAALDVARSTQTDLSRFDDLTGLPNRRALYPLATARWSAHGPSVPLTVFWLDVDHFRQINDSFGHTAGDTVLRRIADLLRDQIREGDFAARIGGDAFLLSLSGDHNPETVARRADHLIQRIARPFEHHGRMLVSTVSIGITTARPGDLLGLDRLLHNAELALHAAKTDGRARFHVFTPDLRLWQDSNDTLAAEMADGLQRGEFVPYFQPQVAARTGKLVGMEALARWHHPGRGVLSPYHFLDVARTAGMLEQIDAQIARYAVLALGSWRAAGRDVPQVSINVSGPRLARPNLIDELLALAHDADLPTTMIGLEIPESAMIGPCSDGMVETVRYLSDAGFSVELDDFGTGHSSIVNLRHFKVSRIKIDRSFIKDIHLHADLSKITSAMIGLAHSLRIDALGKGVETPEERFVLNALGIDHLQGFGLARPMPQTAVEGWFRRTQARPLLPPAPVRSA